MASFYNNYYRFYRPFPMPLAKRPFVTNSASAPNACRFADSANNLTNNKEPSFSSKKENSSRSFSFGPINFRNPFFGDIEEPIFEIFGIQLYLDDIIILGLLFFLYQEGVQDEMLFMALILLLVG